MFSPFIYSKLGKYVPKIIPACAVIKKRERFPGENGIYRRIEDNSKEEGISEIVEAWEYIDDVKKELFLYFYEDIHILYSMV